MTLVRSSVMPNRVLRHASALSAASVREDARAKAVRASYEFWSTGDEVLLERAFAETFDEHAARPPCAPVSNVVRSSGRLGAPEKESK
jgi:hypothetical protein